MQNFPMLTSLAWAALLAACSHDSAPPCVESPDLPDDVFCTGLYVGRDVSKLAPQAMPYTPGVTLWSDGAEKQRFLVIPDGTTIDTSNLDAWTFPVGTTAFKEFRVAGELVETRILRKRDDLTWDPGTYVWSAGEATLNADPRGIILDSGYEIPTQKDCNKCHHGGSDELLGVEAVALALPTATGLTLTELANRGLLSDPPAILTATLPEDATGKAASAIGFLHANCGMPCHSSRGLGEETQLRMRIQATELWPSPTPLAMTDIYLATVNQPPTTASVSSRFPGSNRITSGDHDHSVVYLMAHVRGNYQMPPLVSHAIDEIRTQALADWIDALPN